MLWIKVVIIKLLSEQLGVPIILTYWHRHLLRRINVVISVHGFPVRLAARCVKQVFQECINSIPNSAVSSRRSKDIEISRNRVLNSASMQHFADSPSGRLVEMRPHLGG